MHQDKLLASEFSSLLREMKIIKWEFLTDKAISNIKYQYLEFPKS